MTQKYVFAGGVIAAFECKLTLRKEHVREAFQVAAKIKRKAPVRTGTPYDELNSPPIYGLLAHSHSFRSGNPSSKLHTIVEEYQVKYAEEPRELLDIICVADTATLPLGKKLILGAYRNDEELEEIMRLGVAAAAVSTMYVIHDEDKQASTLADTGAILAGLVYELTYRLAFEDSSIRDWADHLSRLGWYGGIGRHIYWAADVFSPQLSKALITKKPEDDRWSKWHPHLP
jgi:hypothetical protein